MDLNAMEELNNIHDIMEKFKKYFEKGPDIDKKEKQKQNKNIVLKLPKLD
jgi:hypothetical protein